MSDNPSQLHRHILLRLPAVSLFRFRSVCKSWRRIIDDPSFVKSHSADNHRTSATLLTRTSTGALYSFPLDSLNYSDDQQTISVTHVKNLARLGVPKLQAFPVASCNGLVLISHYDTCKIWVIWNPLTGDFHELPQIDIDREVHSVASGLGYDSASDDYRVVRIDKNRCRSVYKTLVYSLRLNAWKTIKDCPRGFHFWTQGVFLNGALHWISSRVVVVLDLATEEYRLVAIPPLPSTVFDLRLDALDGFLVLSEAYMTCCAWVMKDYGAEEWTELFSSKERNAIGGSSGSLWPVDYSKRQGRLIMQHDNKIIRWDIEKYGVKKVDIKDFPCSGSSQVCPGSLFRFNQSGGVKRKRSKAKRLKFTAITTDSGHLSDSDSYPSEDEDINNDYY